MLPLIAVIDGTGHVIDDTDPVINGTDPVTDGTAPVIHIPILIISATAPGLLSMLPPGQLSMVPPLIPSSEAFAATELKGVAVCLCVIESTVNKVYLDHSLFQFTAAGAV